mmetsp:Transcript_42912/g.99972  ORF Transcript_42912/g.99972 Transcript_42912/m.99972 type:complete len:353 (-) Transcript_42912:24-1082(-)
MALSAPAGTRTPRATFPVAAFRPGLSAPARMSQRSRQGLAVSAVTALTTWRTLRERTRRAHMQGRRAGPVEIEAATDADVRPAAEVAVRSLRWTAGWLDKPNFREEDYSLLASREVQAYDSLYLAATPYPSTLLVAKMQQQPPPKKESSWFDFGGSGTPSPKVVGCVGCEVKCFNFFTGEELPIFKYDGGKETVLRPVMADLAVSADCQGKGIGRKLVQKLEEVVLEWGYDELILLVEATNFQARGVYDRMGYRLAGIRPGQVTTYLDTSGATPLVKDRTTVAFLLRKSLKPFPWGSLENVNWAPGLAALAAGAYWQNSDLSEEFGATLGSEPLDKVVEYLAATGIKLPWIS